MATRTVKLMVCDWPIGQKGNIECGKPAIETMKFQLGTAKFEKDICQYHDSLLRANARRKRPRS